MAKNMILTPGTSAAIEDRVNRILNDLGNPEPPLQLHDVRELLSLDLKYYSSTDVNWLRRKIHKLKVGKRIVVNRATEMLKVVQKLGLKAILDIDADRVLVDSELPSPKQRWSEAHEITHRILPWHEGVAMGDRKRELSLSCHTQVESEANYGAGRLLFLGPRLKHELQDEGVVSFALVRRLAKTFGNSMTTALWRIVESMDGPVFGLVSIHPRDVWTTGENPVRYFIRSTCFAKQFPDVTEFEIFGMMQGFCFGSRGPIGEGEVVLTDAAGQKHVFFLECFNNSHDTLSLGMFHKAHAVAVVV